MSIVSAKAISRNLMRQWIAYCLSEDKTNKNLSSALIELKQLIRKHNNIFIITICDVDTQSLEFPHMNSASILTLKFNDIDPTEFLPTEIVLKNIVFNLSQAQQVVDFIDKINNDFPKKNLLLVNCHAGISRSGAIVQFVQKYCNISLDVHNKLNTLIKPNYYILKTLEEIIIKRNK